MVSLFFNPICQTQNPARRVRPFNPVILLFLSDYNSIVYLKQVLFHIPHPGSWDPEPHSGYEDSWPDSRWHRLRNGQKQE